MPTTNPLHEFAQWVANTNDRWPELAIERAHHALIDTIGVSIAGSDDPVVTTLSSLCRQWGPGQLQPVASDLRLSAPYAAKLNGTAAHALDFDDNFDPAKTHASAVIYPALWAVGAQHNVTINQLLDAYIVGLQILGCIGQAVNPYHRNRGWHATATLGTLGAAAACARLLQLNTEQTAHALSLATSYAGGFMSQFGTMAKPLHAGMAAMGAVQAAGLAQAGFTAGEMTLHGEQGLRTLMVGQDVNELAEQMPDAVEHGQTLRFNRDSVGEPLVIISSGLKIKRYPNCGSVHRSLDGLLELRAMHQLTADNVARILVRAPASHLANLMHPDPQDPMQAKFSLEYNLAVGLVRGMVTLADFEPSVLHQREVRAVMNKVHTEAVDLLESQFPTEVHIENNAGERFSISIEMPLGSSIKPLNNKQIKKKFDSCVNPFLEAEATGHLYHRLSDYDALLTDVLALTIK